MRLGLTKKEAEKEGRCKRCISYFLNDPIIPPFTTHCRASNMADRYLWCPKSEEKTKTRVSKSKPKRRKIESGNKQVTIKEYLKSGDRSC